MSNVIKWIDNKLERLLCPRAAEIRALQDQIIKHLDEKLAEAGLEPWVFENHHPHK
jgi:hypothetical protein